MKNQLREAWRRVRARADDAPYVVEFNVLEPTVGEPPASIRGLLMSHVTVAEHGYRFVTYWTSYQAYAREADALRNALGLPEPVFTGFPRHLNEPRKPWWQSVPWGRGLLSLVAILGALEALRTHYAFLFLAPSLDAYVTRRLNYVRGEPFEETITVANRTEIAHENLQFAVSTDRPEAITNLKVVQRPIDHLPDGKEIDVTVQGLANAETRGLLLLTIKAKAGLLRCAKPTTFRIPMRVWPRAPRASVERLMTYEKHVIYQVSIESGLGAAKGVQCSAIVPGGEPITDLSLSPGLRKLKGWHALGEEPPQSHMIQLITPPLTAFQPLKFVLPAESSDPGALARKTKAPFTIRCQAVD